MPTVADLQKPKNIRILLYGPSGAGKTLLGLTLGKGLTTIDLDGNLISGVTYQDEHRPHRMAVEVKDCTEPDPKKPVSWALANSALNEVADAGDSWPEQALMIDSLTALCNGCMNEVRRRDGWKSSGSGGPTMGQYGQFGQEMTNFLITMHSIPRIVVMTAHDTDVWMDDTQGVKIFVPGKMLPPQLPIRFTEIWYLRAKNSGEEGDVKPVRELITVQTESIFACSRLQVPSGTNVDQGLPKILTDHGIPFERRPLD